MATETTQKDITPVKRKGIDITVRALIKLFPFITGYEDDSSVETYDSAHYIDLIIDLNKLSEYMNIPINPYWERLVRDKPEHRMVYALWSYLKFPDEHEVTYDKDIKTHPGYILGAKVTNKLESLYSYLPDNYRLFYDFTSGELTRTYPVRLKVNGYLMT
jgi:hypothetical protein